MSEEEARQAAQEDAAYLAELLRLGTPVDVAARMVAGRIAARLIGDALKPKPLPKEPWQE